MKIGFDGGLNDGGIGLISLDENFGGIEMAASNTPDDLGKQLKSAFLGAKIWQGKTGVGLDNTDRGEVGEVKPAGESLGADEDVDDARFNFGIKVSEVLAFFVVAIKAGDLGVWKEASEFRFE